MLFALGYYSYIVPNKNFEVRFNVRKPHCEFDIER